MKTIEVTIETDGTPTIEGHNFSGKECDKDIGAITDALGATLGDTEFKPEYARLTNVLDNQVKNSL